ncbi:MAG: TolC family protein [Pseudomonadota bacterium]|uniref:TolC family protein n=1 Tax=Candidatus Desulfatibia profunda TaxID=2841695 RepID=A0A8J6NLI7_9BACT|nr:TolC family protein [Candidatus Desulfatibia profunda]MBL7180090.1 TolC family protein [Desulfobacterales bacterium]
MMVSKKIFPSLMICLLMGHVCAFSVFAAEKLVEGFTLKQTIESALAANLGLQSSQEDTKAALATQKAQRTRFFPTFNAAYQYNRNDEASKIGGIVLSPKKEYTFVTTVTQPIFRGFSLVNQFKISSLGLDMAQINEKLVRQDIVFNAQKTYFFLLEAKKLFDIAQKTVTQLKAHKEVAQNYYQVGMTPLNDFLQAQVELANAEQDLIAAKNNLENAESDFNLLLRRPLDTPVEIEDVLDYVSLEQDLDYCLAEANKHRLEIKINELEVEIAQKELTLAKKDYYPAIDLKGSYFKNGTDWDADGGEGITDPSGWNILATASWNFWEWGRTVYGVSEKHSRLSQAQLQKKDILDNIQLEVKNAYLRTQETQNAIVTVEKAVEQAQENFRINQERYKEQVATSTDVLDAQTLLSKTMTNYFKALYTFKISKAALFRAMGREMIE